MIGTRINFKDMYGGVSNVRLIHDDFGDINSAIEDFFASQAGDELMDSKAESATSKFVIFLRNKPVGYRAEVNSVESVARVVDVDLPSAQITSTVGLQPSPEIADVRVPDGLLRERQRVEYTSVDRSPEVRPEMVYRDTPKTPEHTDMGMFDPKPINGFVDGGDLLGGFVSSSPTSKDMGVFDTKSIDGVQLQMK